MPTGIVSNSGQSVLAINNINQGLMISDGWTEVNPKSIQRREPLVMLFNRIGVRSKIHELVKINHLDEAICLGLMNRPIKKRSRPIIQAIICLIKEAGATELTMRMLIEKRKRRLIRTGNHGVLDMIKF